MRIMKRLIALAAATLIAAAPGAALAWGGSGHRMIGQEAMRNLPADLPGFLRSPRTILDVGELSREPDRHKGAGRLHDTDREGAHFIDIDEQGKLLGGPMMVPLAATRADYATQLRLFNLDEWKAGYLPYAIIDRYQQLTINLAYWRVLNAAIANPAWKGNRVWFKEDIRRREALILKDIGELSHFVGDGSQPLHVSIHYNGWGDYPNPNGYTTARIHAPFEGEMVKSRVSQVDVAKAVAPFRSCNCPIEQRVTDYLLKSRDQVIPLYDMEKAGGMKPGDPRGGAFATARLAEGASELRDLIVEAWRASATTNVGWRPIAVQDVLSGKVNPYIALSSVD
jgi:hypothetical protein